MIVLRAPPRLGVVAWLWRSLRTASGPALWSRREPAEGLMPKVAGRLDDGAAVVIGSWTGPARAISRAELIGAPRAAGVIGADPTRLVDVELPWTHPPDMLLDDVAPWALAAALVSRVRVDVVATGGEHQATIAPPGEAWLVKQALSWHDDLSRNEIEELLCESA